MIYIIAVIIIVLGLAVGTGCKIATKTKQETSIYHKPNDTMPSIYTKNDLEKLLQNLSKSEPKDLQEVGAMCYKTAGPPDRFDYVCPTCGEKTLYANVRDDYYNRDYPVFLYRELERIRSIIANIKSIDCKLDESQFCKKCNPQITAPELCLIVKIEGNEEHKTCNITLNDAEILNEFLNGKVKHLTAYDAEEPLKNYLDRIKVLLGM